MIADRIEALRDGISDDDIYDDALNRLQNHLEHLAKIEDNVAAMEALHEILLTRQFLRTKVFSEVDEKVKQEILAATREEKTGSSEGNTLPVDIGETTENKETEDVEDVPSPVLVSIRVIDNIDTKSMFNIDYGYVNSDLLTQKIVTEIDQSESIENSRERSLGIAQLISDKYQKKYEEIDKKYKSEVDTILEEISSEIDDSDNPYEVIRRNIRKHKLRIHQEEFGWPTIEEEEK